jgi:hypothetical protein
MHRRPVSVSVVGWLLSIVGVLGLLGAFLSLSMTDDPRIQKIAEGSPVPLPVHLYVGVAGAIITFISGLYILRGENWARWFYAIWCVAGLLFGAVATADKLLLIPGVLAQGALIVLLFLPKANAYFSRR